MLLPINLLINNPAIIKGLLDGTLVRYGSVIRYAAGTPNGGQIVKHLAEVSLSPVNTGVNVIGNGLTYYKLMGIENTLSSMMGLTQIAAGASVLNLGVSLVGFAYMGYKLHQVQKSLGKLQQTLETGFNQVNTRLDQISEQLTYLYLLVEDSRQKQESLAKAISNIQKALLIKEIATLKAELDDLKRFPNESPRQALKAATTARLFLSSQAIQSTPELEAELMLNSDISIQGWAVATATEASLLLEIGNHQEAKQLLAEEVPQFKQISQNWAKELITNNHNSSLSTAYRFSAPPFKNHITPERVTRITQIYPGDINLDNDQIRRKKNQVDVEFEMSYAQERYHQTWLHQQIAISEYLDSLSELTARLEGLESFASLCETHNLKSSKQILPNKEAQPGLYLLPDIDN